MKRFTLAAVLTGVLSVSALAGEMPTCGVVAATSNPVTVTGEMPTVPGETQTPPGEMQGASLLATLILGIVTWP
jgi:hypothetical protein